MVLDAGVLPAVGHDLRAAVLARVVLARVVDVGADSRRCHGTVELRDVVLAVTFFDHVPDASAFLAHRVRHAFAGTT